MSHTYKPGETGSAGVNLELARLQQALNAQQPEARFQVLHVEPAKRAPGMVVYADGTDWDPGSGEGMYVRDAVNAAWVFLGSTGGGSGDVVGPASATNNHVVFFDGATGKLIKDSGLTLAGSNTGDQTSVTGNAGTATALQTARNIDGQSFNGTADITVIAPGTHAASSKATPVDADELPLVDSAASNVLKKLTWANVKATLKTYLDTLYAAIGGEVVAANVSLGVAGTSLSSGTITAYKSLRIEIWIAGYSSADTASLQFNADTGSNYRYRWLTNGAAATTFTAGNSNVSQDRVKIGSTDITRTQNVTATIRNSSSNTEKLVQFRSTTGTANAATQLGMELGNGAWVSGASTQITRVDLISTQNMTAGTFMVIYGQN